MQDMLGYNEPNWSLNFKDKIPIELTIKNQQ